MKRTLSDEERKTKKLREDVATVQNAMAEGNVIRGDKGIEDNAMAEEKDVAESVSEENMLAREGMVAEENMMAAVKRHEDVLNGSIVAEEDLSEKIPMADPEDLSELGQWKLSHGTSVFLVSLAMTCKLTYRSITMALRMLHRTTVKLPLHKADRKALCAACLCLAWKHVEDQEGIKQSRKIKSLAKGLYMLSAEAHSGHNAGVEAVHWACRDRGHEWSRICDRIKLAELLVLRALNFDIHGNDPEMISAMFSSFTAKLYPCIITDLKYYEGIQATALGVFSDFLLWPESRGFALRDIIVASVLKAGIALGVPLNTESSDLTPHQQKYLLKSTAWKDLLEQFRQMYDKVKKVKTQTR